MRVPLFWRVTPVYLIIAVLFLVPHLQEQQAHAQAVHAGTVAQTKVDTTPIAQNVVITGTPTRIVIPTSGIDVAVTNGYFKQASDIWTVSKSSANYATNSVPNNTEAGKTFIYGHWTKQVFGPTKNLRTGDKAYVYTAKGHIFEYTFTTKEVVNPSDGTILHSLGGKPGMVLMTCEGRWAQHRRIMYFDLVSAV